METNAKRCQKIPTWQLEITVEELSTSIEATIQHLDLTSEVTEDELRKVSQDIKRNHAEYLNVSQQLSSRLIRDGSIEESQRVRNDRASIRHEVKEALNSINVILANLNMEVESSLSTSTPKDQSFADNATEFHVSYSNPTNAPIFAQSCASSEKVSRNYGLSSHSTELLFQTCMSSDQASRIGLNPSESRRSFQDSPMLLHSSASLDKPQTSAATINNCSLSGAPSNKKKFVL